MLDANADDGCVGVIAWMHTFSPAKMWIAGLDALRKPLLHLHTQAGMRPAVVDHRHGLHEPQPGRPRRPGVRLHPDPAAASRRKTVAGPRRLDPVVLAAGRRLGARRRSAAAELRTCALARFGDNMRDVAVTEGDKVEAELRFGVSVNTYGVNDLVAVVDAVADADVDELVAEYDDTYDVAPELRPRRRAARVAALRRPHRGSGCAQFLDRRRLRRLHHELRGPRRAAPAARPGRAAADGRRLRLRRRGRLEDLGAAARHSR